MAEHIELENAYDYNTLEDWFINSVSDTDKPVWTKEHLNELIEDFYVIPKDTPTSDVAEVKHGKWILTKPAHYACSVCNECVGGITFNYCPNCGAKMDKE